MKHKIEIPDLPEDLEAVAYRKPKAGEYYLTPDWITVEALHDYKLSHLIVRRKQPRRIVLEETDIDNYEIVYRKNQGTSTYWKIVKDNKCAE